MEFQRRWLWIAAGLAPLVVATLILRSYWLSETDDVHLHASMKSSYLRDVADLSRGSDSPRPNIILIVLDSLGYGDTRHHNNPQINTENLSALSLAGTSLTAFYSASSADAPARAALLSGRYPPRTQLVAELMPQRGINRQLQEWNNGSGQIPGDEILLPEVLRAAGYDTAMIGKWGLGDRPGHLPTDFGFNSFLGSLYGHHYQPFQLYRNNHVLDDAPELAELASSYLDEALQIIRDSDEKPFFIYLAHSLPTEPLATSPAFIDKSRGGRYGDVIEELDYGLGRIILALREANKLENSLIMVTAIRGAPGSGSAAPFRGQAGSVREGGVRIPFIAYWQGYIENAEARGMPVSSVDIFPTLLDYLRLPIPHDRSIDGLSIRPVFGEGARHLDERNIFYFVDNKLAGLRRESLKLLRHSPAAGEEEPVFADYYRVYNLEQDPAELNNLSYVLEIDTLRELERSLTVMERLLQRNPRGWK